MSKRTCYYASAIVLAFALAAPGYFMALHLSRRVAELEHWKHTTRPCWVLRADPDATATVVPPGREPLPPDILPGARLTLPPRQSAPAGTTASGAGTSRAKVR